MTALPEHDLALVERAAAAAWEAAEPWRRPQMDAYGESSYGGRDFVLRLQPQTRRIHTGIVRSCPHAICGPVCTARLTFTG